MEFKTQTGFSLIEVLISLMLLSLMLFGMDAMELMAVRDNRATYFFNVASNQAQDMAERLRVFAFAEDFRHSVAEWNQENQEVLPQGRGIITGAYPAYQITIFWGDEKPAQCQTIQLGPSGCLTEKVYL